MNTANYYLKDIVCYDIICLEHNGKFDNYYLHKNEKNTNSTKKRMFSLFRGVRLAKYQIKFYQIFFRKEN